MIYRNKELDDLYENEIRPMFGELYEELLRQAKSGKQDTILYRHHISYVKKNNFRIPEGVMPYEETEPNQMVVDFLASVTDDYFLALYKKLFPKGKHEVEFKGYFEE